MTNASTCEINDLSKWDDCSMNAKPSDWAKLVSSLLGCAAAAIVVSLLLNLTGDCGPDVRNCGETARLLSFVILALGVGGMIYLMTRFVRRHRR